MAINGASIDPIYNQLHGIEEQHPINAEAFADWSMQAGDTVTVTRDGKSYKTVAHTLKTVWKGGAPKTTVNSTGKQQRDAVAKLARQKYSKGSGAMRNSQDIYNQVWSEDGHVHSLVSQTASTINAYVADTYKQMKSGLELSSSSAALYTENRYTQMRSGLNLTSSSAALYSTNLYTQMRSGLNLTSSSAALYSTNLYTQMRSGLNLTSSSAALFTENRYTQMKAGLNLTSSSAALYVNNKYDQMKTGLQLTSSSASLYVDNKYNQMKAGLALTSSSSALYVSNETTSAKIIAKINGTGGSSALISADKISLSGDTTLSGKLSVISGGISTNGNIQAGLTGGSYIRGTTLKLLGPSSAQGAMENSLSYYDIDGMIIKAQLDGNTLKLWKHGDNTAGNPSITFSKASGSSKVSGTWSGGAYTVSANENGQDLPISTIIGKYSTSWDDTLGTWVARVGYENPISGAMIDTGCKFEIPNMGDLQSISIVDDNGNTLTSQTISQAITFKAQAVIDNMGYIDHVDGPDITITPGSGTQRTITEVCTLISDKNSSIPVKFKYSDGTKNTIHTTVLSQAQWDAY